MRELVAQMGAVADVDAALMEDKASILDLDRAVSAKIRADKFPTDNFGAPLAGSLIPWIDKVIIHNNHTHMRVDARAHI